MNWQKGIGYGVALWILLFVIASVLVGFKVYDNMYGKLALVLLAGVSSYLMARRLHGLDMQKGFFYGVVWVLVLFVLDTLVTVRFNPNIFTSRSLWAGYVLVLLAPLWVAKRS